MRCWWMWNGGMNYSAPELDDVEEFATIAQAKDEFLERYYGNVGSVLTPCVERIPPEEGGPFAWVFWTDPLEMRDLYPDMVITFGPRGGIRTERIG